MDRLMRMDEEQYLAAMRPEVERILGAIAEAVNNAPDGHLIDGSEMQVRDLMGQLRTMAYEKAVQMRIDETEGAFSPSAGRRLDEQGSADGDAPDGDGAGGGAAPGVAAARRGAGRAGG